MESRWSQFEILTGTGATFLAIAFVCIFLEAARIETDIALRAADELMESGLAWHAVEPRGRMLLVTGAAGDEAAARQAAARIAGVPGVWRAESRISTIGVGPAACQAALDAELAGQPVLFKTGQAELADASHAVLARLARRIVDCGVRVEVAVHAEARGSAAVSLVLTERRADQVARRLVEAGVGADVVVVSGYGSTQPVAQPGEPGPRGNNQRLELRILGAAS